MAAEGAKVLVCDINSASGSATCSSNPSALAFHQMDVTKSADWKAGIAACIEKFGRCDILVNNAGWSYANKPTSTVTEDEFEKVFDVNVKSVYLGCNAWVGQAIERGEGGVVINIASVGATRPRPGLVWYNASKGAVWNVRLPVSCSVYLYSRVPGNKRTRRRIRPASDSRRVYLSLGHCDGSLLCLYRYGGYAREQGEAYVQCTHGPHR